MADELKPPVAIRITRPYATEAEFLEREFDTLTHTSVVLLGAQPRPQGVVLRFEIVLKGGESILRGEGRVVGFKEKAHGGDSGLSLRFTRLDARSKLLVDKAAALRDARARGTSIPPPRPSFPSLDSAPGLPNPPPSRPSTPPPPRASVPPPAPRSSVPPPAPRASVPPPPPSRRGPPPLPSTVTRPDSNPPPSSSPTAPMAPIDDTETTQVDNHFDLVPRAEVMAPFPAPARPIRPTPARPPPLPQPVVAEPSPPPPVVGPAALAPPMYVPPVFTAPVRARVAAAAFAASFRERGAKSIARPVDRDALLTRLRSRAQSLPPARVEEILAKSVRPA